MSALRTLRTPTKVRSGLEPLWWLGSLKLPFLCFQTKATNFNSDEKELSKIALAGKSSWNQSLTLSVKFPLVRSEVASFPSVNVSRAL